jgi:hypothetical protein
VTEKLRIILPRVLEERFDELLVDRQAAEQTMQIAMAHHVRLLASINRSEKAAWNDVHDTFPQLETVSGKYQIGWDLKERRMVLTEREVAGE